MKNNKFLYGLFAVCACAVSAYLFHELLAWFAPDDLGGVCLLYTSPSPRDCS